MRKGHYTFMTLGLAGAIIFGGTGMLSQKISNAKTEKMITTVKKEKAPDGQIQNAGDGKEQNTEKEVFYTKYGIYLPEGAEIKEKMEDGGLKISWNGYQFIYHVLDGEKQTESDLSIGDAVIIAIKSIQEYRHQDVTGKKIEISLQKNILTDDENALFNMDDVDIALNRKNYGVRYYAVDISDGKLNNYSLCINSVTGQVFGYVDYHDRGAKAEYGEEFEAGELKKKEPEFVSIAEDFIKESLYLAEIKEYDFTTGLMETENVCREVFHITCKTTENDVVLITMDPIEKSVLAFEINPLLL